MVLQRSQTLQMHLARNFETQADTKQDCKGIVEAVKTVK